MKLDELFFFKKKNAQFASLAQLKLESLVRVALKIVWSPPKMKGLGIINARVCPEKIGTWSSKAS